MDVLLSNLTSSCSSPFHGYSGAVFSQAIATVLAVHCSYTDKLEWPNDRSEEVWNMGERTSYDFIIVGAGTAGSHLASKLSQQFSSQTILLIEAGDDPNVDSEVPGLLFASHNTGIDWIYKTEGSDKYCLGYKDQRCVWNKGRTMGGSNSINGMLYTRGHPTDYQKWAEGNPGWDYESIKHNFENIENMFHLGDIENKEPNPLYSLLHTSYEALGYKYHLNQNIEANIGMGRTKLLIKNGKRYNTAKLHLNTVKDKTNLIVMKNTRVQKIIIDSTTKTAVGVEIINSNGNIMKIYSNKEVVLSAGSIGTPHILLLSGIGPKSHLTEFGIETLSDLPVGKNLQDHPFLGVFLQMDEKNSMMVTPEMLTSVVLQYMLFRTGPLSTLCITDFMTFANMKDDIIPDMQFHHTHFAKNDSIILKIFHKGIGLKREISDLIIKQNENNDLLGIYPTLLHPKSRGEVLLRDKNPLSLPIIKPNYFDKEDDMDVMLRSIDLIYKLLNTAASKAVNLTLKRLDIKNCSDFSFSSNDYWECYIRHLTTTIYHPVGTAKMGPASDKTAVVDNNLNVHGTNRLRVVDASIMPTITGGNTMAPTLMIAEKASEIIKLKYVKDEF